MALTLILLSCECFCSLRNSVSLTSSTTSAREPAMKSGLLEPRRISHKGSKNGTRFGFAEVNIEIPEPLRPKFEEMCPFFYNKKVPVEAVPEQMLDYLKRTGQNRGDGRKLAGARSAEKLLVYAPPATLVCQSRGGDHG